MSKYSSPPHIYSCWISKRGVRRFLPSWNILPSRKGKNREEWEKKKKGAWRRGRRRNSLQCYSSATRPCCLWQESTDGNIQPSKAGFIQMIEIKSTQGTSGPEDSSWFPFCLKGISGTREKQNIRGTALACFLSASGTGSSYFSPLRGILSQPLCHLLSQGQRFQF